MNLYNAIRHLHSTAELLRDYILQDDGAGPYIAVWRLAAPQPTAEQLAAASDAYDAQQAQESSDAAALRQAALTALQSAVGVTAANWTTGQMRALLLALLRDAGAVHADTSVRPLGEWLR